METDVARFQNELLEIADGSGDRDVRSMIRSRLENKTSGQDRPRLVTWTLTGPGRFDTPLIRRVMPDVFESRPEDGVLRPDDIAESYWMIHNQPRSAWLRRCVGLHQGCT